MLGAYYQVTVTTAIRDTAGNQLAHEYVFGFTAGEAEPAPQIVALNPFDAQAGVPVNSLVKVAFDKRVLPCSLDDSSFTLYHGWGDRLPGTISLSSDGRLAVFAPEQQLIPGDFYVFAITTGVTDMAGVPVSNPRWITFTAGDGPDTSSPEVVSMLPANGTEDVPTNSGMIVQFSEAIDPTSVNGSTIAVTSNGVPVEVNCVVDQSGKQATLSLISPNTFNPFTSYQVKVTTGIKDTAGNPLAQEAVSNFVTGQAEDTEPPNAIAVSPSNSQGNVPINSPVRIVFSEPVRPLAPASIKINSWRGEVSGTISLSEDGREAVFTPEQPFDSYTNFIVYFGYYGAILDMAGNALANQGTFSFNTDDRTDNTPPSVLKASPAQGAQGLPANVRVGIKFDETIDQTSVNEHTVIISQAGAPVPGNFSFDSQQNVLTFLPSGSGGLFPDTRFDVKVTTGVRDTAGNQLAQEFASDFWTGPNADLTPPHVAGTCPYDGERDVPTNSTITITFDEQVDPLSLNTDTLGTWIPCTISVSPDGRAVTLTPTEQLNPLSDYFIQYDGIRDMAGNTLANPGGISFTTGSGPDTTPPLVLETSPANGASNVPTNPVVLIRFSEALNETSVNAGSIIVSRNGSRVNGNFSFDPSGDHKIVRFQISEFGGPGDTYEITVTRGVVDVAGKPLALEYTTSFTTAGPEDNDAPDVASVSPADGVTEALLSAPVEVTFTEPIDPLTLNISTFRLTRDDWDPDGFFFPGNFSVSPDGRKVTFTPAYNLFAGYAAYALHLGNIEDLAGNRLPEKVYRFGTALSPGTDPTTLPASILVDGPGYVKPDGSAVTFYMSELFDSNTVPVPDGTVLAVTVGTSYGPDSSVGTITGGTTNPAYPGFEFFTITDGIVIPTFQTPNLPILQQTGGSIPCSIQVFSVDAGGNLVDRIASAPTALGSAPE